MKLAKPALDVGLYTNQREAMLEFWQTRAGVAFDELLPLGKGVHQLRHRIGESILKINHPREPAAAAAPSGYRRLSIARSGLSEPEHLQDPDGNFVRLVPPGFEGIDQLEIQIAVRNLVASTRFYRDALQLPELSPGRLSCGLSIVSLREDTNASVDPIMNAPGFRYLTIQVYDVVNEHAGILARGGREGRAPVRLGEVAYISFVRDPDGNWIEISQRKSITGSLA